MINKEVPYKNSLLDYVKLKIMGVTNTTPYAFKEEYKDPSEPLIDFFTMHKINKLCQHYKTSNNFINFNNNKITIFMFGAGGVASWVLPQLIKTLYSFNEKSVIKKTIEIKIFDGDTVEPKNLLRQNFIYTDIGENKAKVLASRYNNIYENIFISYVDKYVYSSSFVRYFKLDNQFSSENYIAYENLNDFYTPTFIFNMMDNELSKHMLDFHLASKSFAFKSSRYFCTGCDLNHGLVFTSLLGIQPCYTEYFKDSTFIEEDAKIETHSCAEVAEQITAEQTFDSNSMAANLLVTLVSNCLATNNNINTQRIDFVSTGTPYVTSKSSSYIDLLIIYNLTMAVIPKIFSYKNKYNLNGDTKKAREYRELLNLIKPYFTENSMAGFSNITE